MKKFIAILFILALNLLFITSCSSKIIVIYQVYEGRVLKEEKKESDVTAPSASEKEGHVFICW